MKPRVYIDGQAGTTGLQIFQRLSKRTDIELLAIAQDQRHEEKERKRLMNAADLVFLCLPDAAAIAAVNMIDNPHTKVIDASTAHRCDDAWAYGFIELGEPFAKGVRQSLRIANPGCHASGFIAIVYPLIQQGILRVSDTISAFSLTGYSGGGKRMIADYEGNADRALQAPQLYGLQLRHKHLPEMKKICSLSKDPLFCPIVDDYYCGMATSILLEQNVREVHAALDDFYKDKKGLVHVAPLGHEGNISANAYAGWDDLVLIVCGREEQTIVTALFDNLGKGACGAAIQNMNIALGLDAMAGLRTESGEWK